ncbi:sigma-70 family RNA polymerase sigma factor [Clostridiisalibacter paucivorans]|uniref:sigma-70 family RNA polymerase sigma factor n=1 Tax=Clostridiisalibacter paucivorans TaxID=408753 RepID=UPI00047D0E44|nr:sigma-70 family RNA polymerase sigma factor [Clostridiisalibacter paucivorans]
MQEFVLTKGLSEKDTDEISREQEFTYIFQTYYKRVYNYIYYRVNNHYTAEDLTSSVFEKVMSKIDTYCKGESPFEVWLFAIARNVIRDYFRKFKKRKIFSMDKIKELISKEKTPEEKILTAETNDRLLKLLDILNERERNIIAFKFGANLKNREIAELLDISESNVGVILYRSMKKLKKEMEREG